MKLYKVLGKGLISPYQNFKFVLGKKYTCRDFDENKNNDCSRGFYAVDVDGLPYASRPGTSIYLVDVSGKSVEIDQYKRRYEHIKTIRKCTKSEIVTAAIKKESGVGYKLSEVLYPVNPLTGKPEKVRKADIKNLTDWDSVGDSVWDSVMDSVGAYLSSLFPNIKKWKYIDHEPEVNPFQSAIDLWHRGFVPSFDGKTWRLHSGKNAEIVYLHNYRGR